MKTVLIFVMGSPEPPYPQLMQTSRETWDSDLPREVQTRYYTNFTGMREVRTIQFQVGGTLHDMGRKDLLAYRWALDNLKWEFMARVNASCYVRKPVLLEHVQSLPATGLFRGVKTLHAGIPYLWGGAHYLISRDVIQAFVDNADKWDHREMEDVAMSLLATKLGIALDGDGLACSINERQDDWLCISYGTPFGGFEFKDFAEFKEKIGNQFFIRVKQDGKRERDIWIMREMWKEGV
jgi:hypothetical protein